MTYHPRFNISGEAQAYESYVADGNDWGDLLLADIKWSAIDRGRCPLLRYISIRREADQERSSPEARELSGQIKESGCTAWVQGYLSAQFQIDRAVQNLTKGRWGGNTYLTFPDGRKELLSRNDTAPTVAARDAYCDTTKDYDPVCLVFDPGVQAVGLLDLGATQTWLDNFCRAKPLERLSTAARELYVEQARRFGALPLVIYSDYQP